MEIKEKVERILTMAERLNSELKKLREECLHPNKTGKYGSCEGNWCKSDDDYWISAHCPDCKKDWTIFFSDSPHEYSEFAHSGRMIK